MEMENQKLALITVPLGNGDTRSVFVLDARKLCYAYFKPETPKQTAKLVLDFGASQKIFEKLEAEEVYRALTDASLL